MSRGSLFLGVFVLLLSACKEKPKPAPPPFSALPRGAQIADIDHSGVKGQAVVVPLSAFSFRVLTAGGPTKHRKIDHIVRSLPHVIAVNGSFFDEQKKAMGMVVDERRPIKKKPIRRWSAFIVRDGHAEIVSGKDLDPAAFPDVVIQGQPRLVTDGKTSSFKPQRAERTAVCLRREDKDSSGYSSVTLVVTDPVELKTLATFLARPAKQGGLGCEQALNLDGGPSTQLYVKLGETLLQRPGLGAVPNALAAIPRERMAADKDSPAAPTPQ